MTDKMDRKGRYYICRQFWLSATANLFGYVLFPNWNERPSATHDDIQYRMKLYFYIRQYWLACDYLNSYGFIIIPKIHYSYILLKTTDVVIPLAELFHRYHTSLFLLRKSCSLSFLWHKRFAGRCQCWVMCQTSVENKALKCDLFCFAFVDNILKCDIQIKAFEQYFQKNGFYYSVNH